MFITKRCRNSWNSLQ